MIQTTAQDLIAELREWSPNAPIYVTNVGLYVNETSPICLLRAWDA